MTTPNYRNQIKIVFFDIDETLICKDKDYLPNSVITAIEKLKANGIIPAIATGRSLHSFPPKIKALVQQTQMDLFVTMNGQYVVYQGKVIEKHPIATEKIQSVVNFLTQHNLEYAFVSPTAIAVSAITPEVQSALDPLKADYHVDKDYFLHNEVFQILPFYTSAQDQLVENAGILTGLKTVRWDENSVDLLDAEGSKARGIQAVIHHFGLTMENVMAFGDGLNDLEMLSTVGVGVAMGNGHHQLKAVAKHVTDHIEEDGIYNFLQRSGLI